MFDIRVLLKGVGIHYMEEFLSKPCPRLVGLMEDKGGMYIYIGVEEGEHSRTYFCVKRDFKTPPVIVHVWRIQRALRGYLKRRQRAKQLAVLMGLHSRLGGQSLIACMPVDVLVMKVLRVSPWPA